MASLGRFAGLSILAVVATVVVAHSPVATRILIQAAEVGAADRPLIRIDGNVEARLGDFLGYLRRLTQPETPFDAGQPRFHAYFSLARAVALTHPDHVHSYLDRAEAVEEQSALGRFVIGQWIAGQAMVYANFLITADQVGASGDAAEAFQGSARKALYLDELIRFGEMPPTVDGLERYRAGLSAEARDAWLNAPGRGGRIPSTAEYHRRNRRSLGFQKDVLSRAKPVLHCEKTEFQDLTTNPVLVSVADRTLDFERYQMIFGQPRGASHWRATRTANCWRWALYTAMADRLERLRLEAPAMRSDTQAGLILYRAARGIVARVGGGQTGTVPLARVQALVSPSDIENLRKSYLRLPPQSPQGVVEIDGALLRSVDWSVRRDFVPKRVALY